MKYWNIHATRMNGKSVTCINQLLDTNQDFIIVRRGTGKEKYEEPNKNKPLSGLYQNRIIMKTALGIIIEKEVNMFIFSS